MLPDILVGVPADPPGIAEWEELLVRIDLAPRALRAAVEEPVHPGAIHDELVEVLEDELRWEHMLHALRAGETVHTTLSVSVPEELRGAAMDDLLRAAAELRTRTSAQVQRRGIDVWGWRAQTDGGDTMSAYQLLSLMARSDALHLAALRSAAGMAAR